MPRSDETFEIEPHVFDKERRKRRIKGKLKDKTRKTWDRDPVQKPHSTKKGKKGYSRKESKARLKEIEKEYR
ncbi:MAG: hypothetical protein ACOCUT_00210 [bacterium]